MNVERCCEKDVLQNTSNKVFHSRTESEIVRNASQCLNQRFLLVAIAVLVSPVPTAMQVVCLPFLYTLYAISYILLLYNIHVKHKAGKVLFFQELRDKSDL